ncbi:hypothetical protein CYMTET_44469 [Cymbomonas tetramitiformis]|uniref:Uncharacterized protein n=1 Tax=Cymbomonas tetramitiformis TaxID=36881 RepID=A0AAE0C286_9CHLO|nr:hypothetical protein CYMTET_44469 [Cymbomonas tetramitiformis]
MEMLEHFPDSSLLFLVQDEGNTLPRRNTYAIHPFRDVAYKSRNEPNVIGRAAILHLQSVVKAAMVSSEVQEQATIQLEQLLQERSMLQAQVRAFSACNLTASCLSGSLWALVRTIAPDSRRVAQTYCPALAKALAG